VSSSCSGKVDESSFYISPDELNANSISDIETFKSSYQAFLPPADMKRDGDVGAMRNNFLSLVKG
jgi:hypothetical protein